MKAAASRDTDDISSIFPGGGTAGEVLRAVDWAANELGAVGGWPISLRTIVRTMLGTRQATCLFWGPHLVNLYNDGFIPILGEKHPAAMGQPAKECWSDAWPVVGGLLNDVVARGQAVLFEEMLVPIVRRGTLEDAWWNYSYSPAFDDAGAVVGVLVVATETTAEVAGRKQLEAANLAKDEFLATVSHELRTPLNAILGWSHLLLEDTKEPGRLEQGLAVIRRNAYAQAKLIEDILDVSRIISGKVVIELRRVQLGRVIDTAVESIRPAAAAKRIQLHVAIDDPGEEFIADEDRIQQVVWNLLSNAVKFTPADGEVHVKATREASRISIQVHDTGKGIAPAFLPYVFDRFRQDDASTTKRHGGLGLGLAIVRHLVELHGGTVTARSEGEGRGSTFEIALPIRAVLPPDQPSASTYHATISAQRPSGVPSLQGIHALVVDDEQDARDLVATVLQEAGATVSEASSAAQALAVLASSSIAIVVSDIGMPLEDGYTLIQRMRASDSSAIKDVPALALTAYARAEDRRRAVAAGFQEHVAKPVDPVAIVRTVAALVGR